MPRPPGAVGNVAMPGDLHRGRACRLLGLATNLKPSSSNSTPAKRSAHRAVPLNPILAPRVMWCKVLRCYFYIPQCFWL